ncbi:hypothetical protein K435DRAFT_869884 [Dendrothele bispora CBS 962.96]|uniref:Uncharacterized protein n=1 Tax=Dendrothele bispora (strain CBS 962.96) TaxID=1314807 RepID=A0A4V4HCW0_DENBC|nr:hypothetical protein K435DRAFT_869884 [Dendrothele bispora CBS 962.96]
MAERVWSPRFRSPNFDTRRFTLDRAGLFKGWKALPTALSGLDFFLPQTDSYAGRVVTYSDDDLLDEEVTKLELYSRNSKQIPFYPGLSSVPINRIVYERSVDGKLGRFDPTKNPQLFDKDHPYYPFITRSPTQVQTPRRPEDVPAFLVWDSSPFPREGLGHLSPEFCSTIMDRIWRLQTQIRDIALDEATASWPNFRSSQPQKPNAHNWGEEITFDQMVDDLSRLQRWIKEMDTWIRMGNLLRKSARDTQLCFPLTDVPLVEDSLIGVWMNGMEETDAVWMWQHGVPMFVVHEVKGGRDKPSAITTQRTSDPLLFTDWKNNETCHEWNGLARRSKIRVNEDGEDKWIANSGTEDRSALRLWRSSSMATAENFPGLDTRIVTEEPPVPGMDRYGPRLPDTKVISEDRVPWIIPPKVVKPDSKGQWEWFIEDMDAEDNRCLRYVGRTARKNLSEEDWPYVYFDRSRKRRILLYTEIIAQPGLSHDLDVFGFPGPMLRYYNDSDMTLRTVASNWVYKTENPAREFIGRETNDPELNTLPKLLPEIPPPRQEPTPQTPASLNPPSIARYTAQEEEEELDFGEPTPSPILRPRDLPPIRTPTPPMEEAPTDSTDTLIVNTSNNMQIDEDFALTSGSQKRKRRSSSISITINNVAITDDVIESWKPILSRRSLPPKAPTCLLRLLGFNGTLAELLGLLSKTCQKTTVEIKLARINKIDTPEGTEYWVKAWNTTEAGWFIQSHYDLRLNENRVFEIRLLKLRQYVEIEVLDRNPEEQWTLNEINPRSSLPPIPAMVPVESAGVTPISSQPLPSQPSSSSQSSSSSQPSSSLISRMNVTLQERLEEAQRTPPTLVERILVEPEESSAVNQESPVTRKKQRPRGGKRNRHWNDLLGPVPIRDPQVDMDNWTPELWLSQSN